MGDPGNRLSGTVSVVAMPTILNRKTGKYTSHGPSLRSCHTYFHVLIIYAPVNEFLVKDVNITVDQPHTFSK